VDDVVVVELELANGQHRYFVTWGRIQDPVDTKPLCTLIMRHAREWSRIEAWLASVRATPDPELATELLANQRLIKGYSDTHARGLDKFSRVSVTAERLAGRADAAAWVRRLREAALKDEHGIALDEALRTVESFLQERVPA